MAGELSGPAPIGGAPHRASGLDVIQALLRQDFISARHLVFRGRPALSAAEDLVCTRRAHAAHFLRPVRPADNSVALRSTLFGTWAEVSKSWRLPSFSRIAHTTPAQADRPSGFRPPQFSKGCRKIRFQKIGSREEVASNPILRSRCPLCANKLRERQSPPRLSALRRRAVVERRIKPKPGSQMRLRLNAGGP